MRFFQWVDEHGHYNSKSILARLITRPNRIIRDDATETALDQAELEELDKMSIVRVKWFVQPHYRLPARILPRFHVEHECHFISEFFESVLNLIKNVKKNKVLKLNSQNLSNDLILAMAMWTKNAK